MKKLEKKVKKKKNLWKCVKNFMKIDNKKKSEKI